MSLSFLGAMMFDNDGADIIFVTGAPGSKWSAIAHALMYADGINTSDLSLDRSHGGEGQAMHFGNYFGPGMEFGNKFLDLHSLSKEDLLTEFAAPYREHGGIKLLRVISSRDTFHTSLRSFQ